jgi:hypothetical protein
MPEAVDGSMDRKPSLQDITWLLELRRFERLDLNPPYQRKSVWSLGERQRFLDTILNNYPSPAIFLHKTFDDDGRATYHVVDGKQRLETILAFVDGRIRVGRDFGDARVESKKWSQLEEFPGVRKAFWNYQLVVEQLDDIQEPLVREIFERLNRNSRKLERQEMRHARFDGWLITHLEAQAEDTVWVNLRVSSRARAKRMSDVQILSELAALLINGEVSGFDQDNLDALYANFENPDDVADFDSQAFEEKFAAASAYLNEMALAWPELVARTSSLNHLYVLWAVVVLDAIGVVEPDVMAVRYRAFIERYEDVRAKDIEDPTRDRSAEDPLVLKYVQASTGPSTEPPQRLARYEALRDAVIV